VVMGVYGKLSNRYSGYKTNGWMEMRFSGNMIKGTCRK